MRDLHGLADASTPAYLTVWNRGGGTLVARRHSSDSGSMFDRDGSVGVCLLQGDAHQSVWAALEALLCNRRAQHVAQQRLASRLVERARARGRVQAEPIQRGAAACGTRARGTRAAEAAHPLRPGGGAWPDTAEAARCLSGSAG